MGAFVEWFLTGSGAEADPFDRRRVLVQGAFASALVSAGFFAQRLALEPTWGVRHVNVLGATLVMAACPFVLRFTGAYRVAAHLLVAGLLAFVGLDAVLYGGLASPPVFALFVVPPMAVFYLGTRAGGAYTALVVLALGGLYALEHLGRVGEPLPAALLPQMRLAAVVGCLAFVGVLAAVYEAERKAAVARARAIVDHLHDGLVAVDRQGVIVAANGAAAALLEVDALVGARAAKVLPPELLAVIEASEASGGIESGRLELSDERVATAAASPIALERGGRAGTVLTVRDVTVEVSIDRMKTEFIATVSHEMRTPLTSVLGFAKLIRSKLDADVFPRVPEADAKAARTMTKVRQNLGIIVEEGERLTALIGDVLDIAKLESGQMEWHKEHVEVGPLVERALDATGGLFTGREVELVADVAPELPTLHADAQRILQVLINLISNASKFTEAGSVTVRAAPTDDGLALRVEDTGGGIAPADQEKIFERFRQAGDTLLDKPRGTGLGLPICVEIVQAHGGTIRVESELGQGAAFVVELPRA